MLKLNNQQIKNQEQKEGGNKMEILYNDFNLSSIGRVLEVQRPLMPTPALTTGSIPGKDGSILYYKQFSSINILVKLLITTKDVQELRQKIRLLSSKINYNEPKKLIFNDEPDKYINAIISDGISLEEIASYGKCTLDFLCTDPYWYAVDDDIITIFKKGQTIFNRQGTAISYPIIEVYGASNNNGSFIISNEETTVTFTGELKLNEKLILDSDLMTAYILTSNNEKISVIQNLDLLDFITLNNGENKININTLNGASLTKVIIKCKSRWL